MEKKSQFSAFSTAQGSVGPTLGTLEHKIMFDARLDAAEKEFIMQQVKREVGFSTPSATPLADLLPRLGGGVLGFLVAKYFQMSLPGQVISTMAGYGIGKVIGDFYKATTDVWSGRNQHRIRSLI
jgi:hypothetical protein